MLTVCWAAKGGSGTTVVSCALALLGAATRGPTWLIDLAGDAPAALGMAEPAKSGVHDWVLSAAPVQTIESIGIAAAEGLLLIARGGSSAPPERARWADLGQVLAASPVNVVVDAGSGVPPPGLVDAAQHRLLVTRPCYLALRRAAASAVTPTGVVVVHEPGRALRAQDVAYAVQAPVVAEISLDPAVARAVDAGLLASRLPRTLSVALSELAV
ncbi:unannotated protein [freshwater metagenome]|uniref:Unannotated protein n=1 Tax=freshwater metagenome TaxID=449393 RepID=A0A6J7FCQ8_9ZZZZ|nr:hypothetical protein [Actinomycetota bacterium]